MKDFGIYNNLKGSYIIETNGKTYKRNGITQLDAFVFAYEKGKKNGSAYCYYVNCGEKALRPIFYIENNNVFLAHKLIL